MNRTQPPSTNADRERLIESHLPLVRMVARRYVGRGEEFDDLVQVGTVGLIKATDRFDPGRGVAFRAFAAPAIEGEIRHHLRDRTGSLRIPRALQRMNGELRRCREQLTATLGRSPTVHELAGALGADEDDVERALLAARARDSLEISPNEPALPPGSATQAETRSDDRLLLRRSMQLLGERERRIVFLRFHADMTERQIAQVVGISQAQVSRVLTTALAKLRQHLARGADGLGGGDITAIEAISAVPEGAGGVVHGATDGGSRIADVGGPPENRDRDTTKEGTSRGHSGRFLVRMPSELHEQLAQAAGREHVSLNRFVTDALAASIASAERTARAAEPGGPDAPEPPSPQPSYKRARTLRIALATNLVLVAVAGVAALVLLALALQRGA